MLFPGGSEDSLKIVNNSYIMLNKNAVMHGGAQYKSSLIIHGMSTANTERRSSFVEQIVTFDPEERHDKRPSFLVGGEDHAGGEAGHADVVGTTTVEESELNGASNAIASSAHSDDSESDGLSHTDSPALFRLSAFLFTGLGGLLCMALTIGLVLALRKGKLVGPAAPAPRMYVNSTEYSLEGDFEDTYHTSAEQEREDTKSLILLGKGVDATLYTLKE